VLPKYHVLAAGAAAIPLALAGWRPLDLALFAAGAVLIDGDHYLGYVWETGDLSLPRAYAYHRKRYHRPRKWGFRLRWPYLGIESSRVLHSAPVILATFLLAWPLRPLRPLAWGLLFHRLQDELYGAVALADLIPTSRKSTSE
jgi:hypothetical protein